MWLIFADFVTNVLQLEVNLGSQFRTFNNNNNNMPEVRTWRMSEYSFVVHRTTSPNWKRRFVPEATVYRLPKLHDAVHTIGGGGRGVVFVPNNNNRKEHPQKEFVLCSRVELY
jgi:hypothetical protein